MVLIAIVFRIDSLRLSEREVESMIVERAKECLLDLKKVKSIYFIHNGSHPSSALLKEEPLTDFINLKTRRKSRDLATNAK